MCNIEECVSGGRPGGVEGTRSPGGDFGGKGEEYKDEHLGKERMVDVDWRNGGLGMDSSKEAGKEDFALQDLGVEESEDRRIGDEIEHEVGFGGIEALTRKCIMDKKNMFLSTFESSIDHCQLPWCEIPSSASTSSVAPITNE